MANIKSSKKHSKFSKKKRILNNSKKSRIKNCIKKFKIFINLNKLSNLDKIKKEISCLQSILDKGASKRIIHKRKAARLKSKLTMKINNLLKNK